MNTIKWAILAITSLISLILYIYSKITESEIEKENIFNIIKILLLSGVGIISFDYIRMYFNAYKSIVYISSSILICLLVTIYFLINMSNTTFGVVDYISGTIITLIILFGLSLFFYIFSNYLNSSHEYFAFFINFIFYIPCLLLTLIRYIINEFKLTTSPVLILFIIEILLIVFYLYLPEVINSISVKDGIPILEGVKKLSNETAININEKYLSGDLPDNWTETVNEDGGIIYVNSNTGAKTQDRPIKTLLGGSTVFDQYNYTLSLWTYLNAHNTTLTSYNKESNIFTYDNIKITYNNKDNNGGIYKIYFTDIDNTHDIEDTYYELSLPYQKWNHIVFNYHSTHVDLFINGKLERTFKQFNAKVFTNNNATIGSVDGLNGSICNIRYYPNNLSKTNIAGIYKLLMNNTPPKNKL
jgi:hypothetical protein